jgi:hypothetical protein
MKLLKMKFGTIGDNVDAHGIKFFGDFETEAHHFGKISEMLSSHENAPIAENKRVTLWFTFKKIHAYKSVEQMLDKLIIGLRTEGYTATVSSVEDLVDTTSPEYEGRPESKFPLSDRMHGYNAACGFSVTAVKKGGGAKFSVKEIKSIQKLAMDRAEKIYGRKL